MQGNKNSEEEDNEDSFGNFNAKKRRKQKKSKKNTNSKKRPVIEDDEETPEESIDFDLHDSPPEDLADDDDNLSNEIVNADPWVFKCPCGISGNNFDGIFYSFKFRRTSIRFLQ